MGAKNDCIVLYPYPAMGHLISMVELGKRFLDLTESFTVLVIVAEAPFVLPNVDAYIKIVSETHPSIVFVRIPPLPYFYADDYYPPRLRTIELAFEFMRASKPFLRLALQAISLFTKVRALFLDFFGSPVMDVADELGIPPYLFMASPAAQMALFLYLPTMHLNTTASFKDLDGSLLEFPGLPLFPAADIPQGLEDRNKKAYQEFLEMSKRIARAAGFVINTFDPLEPRAVKALADGVCLPDGRTPPCYTIGPLVAPDKGDGGVECLKWLDSQPRKSVVFLSFGSMITFPTEQLREIAAGLERSGRRFLWVLRSSDDKDADLDALLPEGFLDRTRGRGLVWKSWTEQAAVLSRESIGAFVTHCGWNSILEGVCAGVPMVAWPLYAEQRLIKVLVVEEMKLGVSVEFEKRGLVSAGELEKRVRELLESEEGNAIRERAEVMKAKATSSFREGGSSQRAFLELAKTLGALTRPSKEFTFTCL
ncbi:anthocyanidin 5,3-O-glucosyltransferase [Aristolochia californica]|uniref:anthocyanidin 5,3-O-glucosyltransferase n=1 Tax=Aristolochia californica TaxID=171875 RepID=UPI0035D795AB